MVNLTIDDHDLHLALATTALDEVCTWLDGVALAGTVWLARRLYLPGHKSEQKMHIIKNCNKEW